MMMPYCTGRQADRQINPLQGMMRAGGWCNDQGTTRKQEGIVCLLSTNEGMVMYGSRGDMFLYDVVPFSGPSDGFGASLVT